MQLVLHSSKTHGEGNHPQKIKISNDTKLCNLSTEEAELCPYQLLRSFGRIRGPYTSDSEPFFVFRGGVPVQPHHMRKCLYTILDNIGKDATLFGMHSFRIGRSNDLAKYGVPVEKIMRLVRWKSNAVYKYFR